MATNEKALSIQAYKPAKGIRLTVTLKDGTEIVGKVTSQTADSVKQDAEVVPRRKIRSISFRGRVLAERATRSKKKARGKKKLSARTASGAPRKRRGRSLVEAVEESSAEGGVSFTLNGDSLVVSRKVEMATETLAFHVGDTLRDKLAAFGIAEA